MRRNRGMDAIHNPAINKSTGFSLAERKKLGLIGLLPDVVESEDLQLQRVMRELGHKTSDLDRYIYLINLLDHDETLFYKTIMSNPSYFLPLVYDPTIGEACLKFDAIFRGPRGMYLSIKRKAIVKEVLRNWPEKDIRCICVTDGGRILGLGDLGANGMGIPIGKLQLYTAAAGVPPKYLLPICLDVGTNNETLLKDPLYLGIRQTRPSQKALYSFVDAFVEAVQEVFPKCCIHFEDWTGVDAVNLLKRYRNKICCFNDDIQGTACIVLAGLVNAMKIKREKVSEQRFLFLGAGSAGIGIANLLVSYMTQEGLSEKEARQKISLFDQCGLLDAKRKDLLDFQKPYARRGAPVKGFADAVRKLKPTAIIGVSTVGGAFSKEVVQAMRACNKRPIIFALSNPTEHAECTAQQAYDWTNGSVIFAAGVQFPPVVCGSKTYYPGQANNFYVFPALGMAVFATEAKRVNDEMFIEAAKAIATQVSPKQLSQGLLYPPQSDILETEIQVAANIAHEIFDQKLARVPRPKNIEAFIRKKVYKPSY